MVSIGWELVVNCVVQALPRMGAGQWSNRHWKLLNNNLKWQCQAEELAGRHEQRIADLEKNLKEKEVYISNIKCMLADLSGRVNEMEGKLCRCQEEDVEVEEVEDDDPTSELSYKTVYCQGHSSPRRSRGS